MKDGSFVHRFLHVLFLSAVVLLELLVHMSSLAQEKSHSTAAIIAVQEDSLKVLANKIVNGIDAAERFRSDSQFTRILVRALKQNHSFFHPFDSLASISRLYAPDSSFRVFTWQVSRDEDLHRRHGAIQINTPDGSLKLFPLIDRSFMIDNQADTVTNHQWWIGSIYYRIILKEFNGRKYYTFIGYDEHSIRSTKKRIEIMHFDQRGEPVFGGPFFSFAEDTIPKKDQSRFWIEFKKYGNARMLYDEDLDMIMFEHLVSETNEPAKKYTFIPDGDYEGFKWKNGKWVHVEKVFTFKLEDGQAPVEKPIKEKKLGKGS
jgi:hypothetical protein